MSASVHTTTRPLAASVPIRRAEPEPRLRAERSRRTPSRPSAQRPEPSVEPSSTTTISHEYSEASRAAAMRSSSAPRWADSL